MVANTTIMMGLPFVLLRLRRHAFVHLHVTQAFTPEMVWLASRFKRFHYIAHIHLDVPPSGAAGFLLGIYKSLFLRRVLRAASMVVVFTNDQKHEVHTRYHIPLKSIRVIPNGVEDAFYFNKARRVHERPRLLFVGRLGYQKNIPLLLHALEGISEKFDTTLVGDGELRSALETQTQEMQLQHIQFVGRADGEQLINHYRNADIFVLPSEREGMPLVLLEAMAMGLPIVATDVTGSRDVVVNDRNGILIPLDDAAAFRAALLSLRDKRLYARLHYEARQMADAYSWYKIARRFTDLYEEVA